MAKTIAQIKAEAQAIKNATEVGENTAARVGGTIEDVVDYVDEAETNIHIDIDGGTKTVKYNADDLTSRRAGFGYLTDTNTITVASHNSFTRWIIPNNGYKTVKAYVIYKGGSSGTGIARVLLYFHVTASFVFDPNAGYIQTDNDYVYYPDFAVSSAQHGSTYYWLTINGDTEIPIPDGVDRIHVCTESPTTSTKPIVELYKDEVIKGLEPSVNDINEYIDEQIEGDLTEPFSFTNGVAISASTGGEVSSTVFSASNYVEISGIEKIRIRLPRYNTSAGGISGNGIGFYDANKTFISGFYAKKYKPSETIKSQGDTREYIVDVPNGAVYMRTTYFATSSAFYDGGFYCYNFGSIEEKIGDVNSQVSGYDSDLSDADFTLGKAITVSGYSIVSSSNFMLSDYININGSSRIQITMPKYTTSGGSSTGWGLVFFDASKTPFHGIEMPMYDDDDIHVVLTTIDVPRGAAYLRATYWNRTSVYYEDFSLTADGLKTRVNNLQLSVDKLAEKGNNINDNYKFIGHPSIYRSASTGTATVSITFTSLCAMYDQLVTDHPGIFSRKEDFGTATGNYELRRYSIAFQPKVFGATSADNLWDETLMGRRRIVILGGVHGDESASTYGVFLTIKEIVESNDDWADYIKNNFIIDVCPCVNPWGLDNARRQNANNVDINRDFADLTQPESQALAALLQSLPNLHAVIDNHNTVARYGYLVSGQSYERKYLYSMISAQLASAIMPDMATLYNDASLYPYEGQQITDAIGQTHWFCNNVLNVLCVTSEVPRGDGGTFTNTTKYIEQTKDVCINLIMMFGD